MSEKELKARHHKKDEGRKDLAGEHPMGDPFQLIFGVIFLAVWILDSFVLRYSTFLSDRIPWFIRWPVGSGILGLSFFMARSGMKTVFGEIRETPHVIRKGMFSIVRHPIYLSVILLYLGLISLTISLLSAGIWLVIIVFYRYISRYEEKLLINIYGDDYLNYREQVPMLFPRIFRRHRL